MAGKKKSEVLQGTLDMMILKALVLEPLHGYGLSVRLQQITDDVFQINAGSIFPALHRMEKEGWISGTWGATENNRRAKFYRLTAPGSRELQRQEKEWQRVTTAIGQVLGAT